MGWRGTRNLTIYYVKTIKTNALSMHLCMIRVVWPTGGTMMAAHYQKYKLTLQAKLMISIKCYFAKTRVLNFSTFR